MRNHGYYETDRAVSEYLLFHYGAEDIQLPWAFGPRDALGFPVRCVSQCLLQERVPPRARALDLGCAVGRSTFELARSCSEVTGVDSSERFIAVAQQLQREGAVPFEYVIEGHRTAHATARLPMGIDPRRVTFETGDALNVRQDLGTFEVILAANLLDRVPRPRDLLRQCSRLLRPGGQLILTSPYTWTEDYAPASEWLAADEPPGTSRLANHLPDLTCVRRLDLPFLIREHARKFQWSVAEATVWIREPKSLAAS